MSGEGYHVLYLGDKYAFPTCTCKGWEKFLIPCKHFLAVFEHVPGLSWNSLGGIYTKSPFFSIDYKAFGLTKVTQSLVESQEDKQVEQEDAVLENNQFVEVGNKKEIIIDNELKEIPVKEKNSKITFCCREMLKRIMLVIYIVDHSTALEELKENLRNSGQFCQLRNY